MTDEPKALPLAAKQRVAEALLTLKDAGIQVHNLVDELDCDLSEARDKIDALTTERDTFGKLADDYLDRLTAAKDERDAEMKPWADALVVRAEKAEAERDVAKSNFRTQQEIVAAALTDNKRLEAALAAVTRDRDMLAMFMHLVWSGSDQRWVAQQLGLRAPDTAYLTNEGNRIAILGERLWAERSGGGQS